MHKVTSHIEEKIQIPILHIADATANQIQKSTIQTVGLLGTSYTMEQDFYKSRIESRGIKVITPTKRERDMINKIIYEELCVGRIRPSSKKYYEEVMNRLVAHGAEGIILGCTEIGLLVQQEDSKVPLFDTTVIHALEAVHLALAHH